MTHMTPEEDLAFLSPAQIAADVKRGEVEAIWRPLAAQLGWSWSHAHGGYINEAHRDQGSGWDSYRVAADAEEACDWCGVETLEQALGSLGDD